MSYAMNNTDGVPVDLDLDAIMADLPLDLAATDGIDEIIGEVPLEPEAEETIEAAQPEDAEEVIEAAPVVTPEVVETVMAERPQAAAAPSLADLDDLLNVEIVPSDELSEEESAALAGEIVKAEAYAAQESEVASPDDELEVAPGAVTTEPKAKRAKKAAAPAAPKVTKDLTTLAPEHFGLTDGAAPDEDVKTTVLARRPKQVKIAEKFDGTIAALAAGRAPSVYVTKCFAALDARKEVTSGDLVAALQAADYSIGTARSQAGQVMELFKILEIADRSGQKLTLRATSAFAAKLRALPAA